jgi:hypothetical protein
MQSVIATENWFSSNEGLPRNVFLSYNEELLQLCVTIFYYKISFKNRGSSVSIVTKATNWTTAIRIPPEAMKGFFLFATAVFQVGSGAHTSHYPTGNGTGG